MVVSFFSLVYKTDNFTKNALPKPCPANCLKHSGSILESDGKRAIFHKNCKKGQKNVNKGQK